MLATFHYLPIVGELDVGWKHAVDLCMQAYFMTGMDEVCLVGTYPLRKGDGIVQQLMGMMGLPLSQGVDHQHFSTSSIRHLYIVNGLHVGDIDESGER